MPGPYGPPRKMPFGRHKGELLAEMHQKDLESTLDWLAGKPDSFQDLRAEIQKILAGRRGGDNPAGWAKVDNTATVTMPPGEIRRVGPATSRDAPATSRDVYDMALRLIKVGANALDGLEHTGQAADWLRSLAGAPPPNDSVPF